MPELPESKRNRFKQELGVKPSDAKILTETKELADFFESALEHGKKHDVAAQQIANYIINRKPDISFFLPTQVVEELKGKKVGIIADEALLKEIVFEAISENQKAVEDYKKGKENALQVILGAVMKKTSGKADINKVKNILTGLLDNK